MQVISNLSIFITRTTLPQNNNTIMKNQIIILTTILLSIFIAACDREEMNAELEEEQMELPLPLGDCWTEVDEESVLQFAGSNHTFCFLNDTEFTLELDSWTDIIADINAPSQWTEYIKGTYTLTNDSFMVTGRYMDSEFLDLVTSRFGETEFENTYEVTVVSETEFILNNNDDQPYLGIRLLK